MAHRSGSVVSGALAAFALLALVAGGAFALELGHVRISGGGAQNLLAGGYSLSATIGQPEASEVSRTNWVLRGGFWADGVTTAGVDDGPGPGPASVPLAFALYPIEPNPLRADGVLRFDLPGDERVLAALYDVGGRRVATPVDQALPAGRYTTRLSTGALAPGVYLLRVTTSTRSATRRVVVLH
jgi:hypothetical protein